MDTQPPHSQVCIAYCTCPNPEVAKTIAERVVDERLAACVNLLPHVTSIYRWQDDIATDQESLLMIKTTQPQLEALTARIAALHPYEVPEVIALPIAAGHENYLEWVRQCTATTL
jgi:periplasmic divalent cation tolerance protein